MDSSTDPRQGLNFLIDDHTNVAIATTVYIIKEGKVLLMKQTKPHTVVDGYYVGIGGKTPIKTNLKQDREKCGFTQEQLAEILEISWRQLQRIEKDETKTKISTLKKIIKVLNIPDEEIIKLMKK